MTTKTSLDDLRREIDAIDDSIHDLLIQRTRLVNRIGARKRRSGNDGLALRPGREAQIIRRLVKRHKGPFPRRVLVRVWRELLSAQVAVQGRFSLAVFEPEGSITYRLLARDQFGSLAPMNASASLGQVLTEVAEGTATIGILPMPMGDRPEPWWRGLVSEHTDVPRIVARIPFAEPPAGAEATSALVVAKVAPEPTGDDVSLLAIELNGDMSRDRLRAVLHESHLPAEWLSGWQDPAEPSHALNLLAVDEHLEANDPRLIRFRERVGEAVARALPLGTYARPLTARALKE